MGDNLKPRTLKTRFNRGSSTTMFYPNNKNNDMSNTARGSKERLTSFANMVNIFMGPGTNVGSPHSSMDLPHKKK